MMWVSQLGEGQRDMCSSIVDERPEGNRRDQQKYGWAGEDGW